MAFDYSNLLEKIKEVFGTQGKFALAIELSERSLSLKLNNQKQWKQNEMIASCEALGMSLDYIQTYFFTEKVQ
jgi:hypothetical protein